MEWILYVVIAFLIVLLIFGRYIKKEEAPKVKNGDLPYKKRDDFLSASELSFYHALKTFVENKAVICPKVGVKEVIFIDKGVKKDYMKFFNWIAKKHVDFILCDANTMQPACAVELDDKSHQKDNRKQRDEFIDRVFDAAKIPMFHIPAKNGYASEDFESILNCFSGQAVSDIKIPDQVTTEDKISQPNSEAPLCPKCDVPMVKRKARQGANTGEEFYGCPNYPKCREIKQI